MQAPSLCSDVNIPVWVLRGVSVSFWEEGFVRGIFGWTWLFVAFGLQWPMGVFQTHSKQVCMQWCPNPSRWELCVFFPARIAAFMYPKLYKSSPKPPCILSNLFPIWGYVYQLRKDFWPRSLPKPSQTLCHTYYCHCSGSHQARITHKHSPRSPLFFAPC